MKKLLSLLLAFAMIFSATFALAEGEAAEPYISTQTFTLSDFAVSFGDGKDSEGIDLSGLSISEKDMVGQYGLESLLTLAFGDKALLNAMLQLSPEGILYFGADRLSHVYALDIKSLCKDIYNIAVGLYRDFKISTQITDADVHDFLKGALDTIKQSAGELLKSVGEKIAVELKKAARNTDVTIAWGATSKEFSEAVMDCVYVDLSFSFKEPVRYFDKKCTAVDFTLLVENSEKPSYLSFGAVIVGEKDVLHTGELRILAPTEEAFDISLLREGEVAVSGSYVEGEDGAYLLNLSGKNHMLTITGSDVSTDLTAHHVADFALTDMEGKELATLSLSQDREGEKVTADVTAEIPGLGTATADLDGTFKLGENDLALGGPVKFTLAGRKSSMDISFNYNIAGSTVDETIDLSTGDKYEINSIESLFDFFEDKTFNEDVAAMMLSLIGEFATIPAINQAIAAAN